ncbi:MAG: hypothetical protein Q9209_005025 [Squamulea sp. 1 TL-2023]
MPAGQGAVEEDDSMVDLIDNGQEDGTPAPDDTGATENDDDEDAQGIMAPSDDSDVLPAKYRILQKKRRPYRSQKSLLQTPSSHLQHSQRGIQDSQKSTQRRTLPGQRLDTTSASQEHFMPAIRRAASSDEEDEDDVVILWAGTTRRPKFQSSAAHAPVLKTATAMLQATIFSDRSLEKELGGLWPEAFKAAVSRVIGEVWHTAAQRLGRLPNLGNSRVAKFPTANEARRMYDSIGDFRAHMAERVRGVVRNHYDFSERLDNRRLVDDLLSNDDFTYEILDTVNNIRKHRFLAPVIVKAIVGCFFQNDRNGLGLCDASKHMFKKISAGAIVTVSTMIRHAISEWEIGERKMVKFEGFTVQNTFARMSRTWHAQCKERQDVILEEITIRIRRARGAVPGDCADSRKPVPNIHKDDIDDLKDIIEAQNVYKFGTQNPPVSSSAPNSQGTNAGIVLESGQQMDDDDLDLETTRPRHLEQQPDGGREGISTETIPGRGYRVAVNQTGKSHQLVDTLSLGDFFAAIGCPENGRFWYTSANNKSIVVDDDQNYSKFIEHAVSSLNVEITLGGDDDFNSP